MKSSTIIRVRYAETDAMKYVWHGNYFKYFEVARTDLIRLAGISYRELEEIGIMMPLIDCSCNFKVAGRYDDEIEIITTIKELTAARMSFSYSAIRKEDGKILAEGVTSHAFMSRDYKAVNLKKKNPELYAMFMDFTSSANDKPELNVVIMQNNTVK